MTREEMLAVLADESKKIVGDITWSEDEDHSIWVQFRASVGSDAAHPLTVHGSFNPIANKLSFALVYAGVGRVYGLDMGSAHHNPSCNRIEGTHKHGWDEATRDKEAYAPADITAPVTDPVAVWKQFCA